jgi:hypothetical protein
MRRSHRGTLTYVISVFLMAFLCVSMAMAAPPEQKMPIQQNVPHPATPIVQTFPDLIVAKIDFVVVQNKTWGTGTPCKIYNLIPTVANVGNTPAGPYTVTIERNKGAGGAYELACPTCTYSLNGLAKGENRTLEPRQFNNCSSNNWNSFKVTVDPANTVHESNENNNSMTRSFISN